MNIVDCYCNGRPDLELAPVPINKLIILTFYVYSGDEHFLSNIVSCGSLTMEKDVCSFIKDDSCIIARAMLELEASNEHEDHDFLYVEVM